MTVGLNNRAKLPPRKSNWLVVAIVDLGLACAALALPGMVGISPVTAYAAAGGLLVMAAWSGVRGVRKNRRYDQHDRVVEGLSKLTGWPTMSRGHVVVGRWSGGWPGTPGEVTIAYHPSCDHTDDAWVNALIAVLDRRLESGYKLDSQNHRKATLTFVEKSSREREPKPEQQQRIERVMNDTLGGTARVTAVQWDDPDTKTTPISFTVTHQNTRVASPQKQAAVQGVVSGQFPGRWRGTFDLESDSATFERRPAMPTFIPHPVPDLKKFPATLPNAVGEDGEDIGWGITSGNPHSLVIGKTGKGKTVVINGLVVEAAARGWPVWISDPKRVEFMGMRDWANVQMVATNIEEQVAMIFAAKAEMERRYAQYERKEVTTFEPLIIVLDEYTDFAGALATWYSAVRVGKMPAKPHDLYEAVGSIARKGRTAQVALCVGAQRPDISDFLAGSMRDNFGYRSALGPLSATGSKMLWESWTAGVDVPNNIPGRGTGRTDAGKVVETQSFWTPDPYKALLENNADDVQLLASLWPAADKVRHPKLEIRPDADLLEEQPSPDGKKMLPPNIWEAWKNATLVPNTHDTGTDRLWHELQGAPLSETQRVLLDAVTGGNPQRVPTSDLPPAVVIEPDPEPEPDDTPDRVDSADLTVGDFIDLDGEWVLVEAVVTDDITGEITVDFRDDLGDPAAVIVDAHDQFDVRRTPDPDNVYSPQEDES